MDFVIDLNKKLLDVYNSYIIIRNYAENLNMKDSNIYKLSNNFVENFDLLQREILSINRKEENNNARANFESLIPDIENMLDDGMYEHILNRKKEYENTLNENVKLNNIIEEKNKPEDIKLENVKLEDVKLENASSEEKLPDNIVHPDLVKEEYDDVFEEEVNLDEIETNPTVLLRLSETERETLLENIYNMAKKRIENEHPGNTNEELIFKEADRLLKIYMIDS
jgi:hypothetical protein